MAKVGLIGWRGMVGSVLMERMKAERDFDHFEPVFASTSQVGQKGPDIGVSLPPLMDAFDVEALGEMDIILTCQGSGYSKEVHGKLRARGWNGYWIDASSAFRMNDESVIVLDPVNREVIDKALTTGVKDYIGGNCSVSLMLMAVNGLFREGLVEWISAMTYQAASGAGANNMRELVKQMAVIGDETADILAEPSSPISALDTAVSRAMKTEAFPVDYFTAPLAGSALAWIDSEKETGQSREEWKGMVETNKILETSSPIPVDGICVRIGSMRCHAQALTIKLSDDRGTEELTEIIRSGNDWVEIVANNKADTLNLLTPAAVAGKLGVRIGRIRKMNLGPKYLTAFTVGDQLLWGAAEPLRRVLRLILDKS